MGAGCLGRLPLTHLRCALQASLLRLRLVREGPTRPAADAPAPLPPFVTKLCQESTNMETKDH